MQIQLDQHRFGADYTELEHGLTLYVHFCSGQVEEVTPATAVRVTDDAVLVLVGERIVKSIPRKSVYFATDERMVAPAVG